MNTCILVDFRGFKLTLSNTSFTIPPSYEICQEAYGVCLSFRLSIRSSFILPVRFRIIHQKFEINFWIAHILVTKFQSFQIWFMIF